MSELAISDENILDLYNWIPTEFNIFGCEYSTDIDIAIKVPYPYLIDYYRKNKTSLDLTLIIKNLELLGLEPDKTELDVNLIYIDPNTGNLTKCLKGSNQTQNMIFYTYNLHPQIYPIFFTHDIPVDIIGKLKLLSKLILDSMNKLIDMSNYPDIKKIKTSLYTDFNLRLDFSFQILNQSNWNQLILTEPCLTKLICFKISQIILSYHNDKTEYTKKTISEAIEKLLGLEIQDKLLYIFSRGKLGIIENPNEITNIFEILLKNYNPIIQTIKDNLNFLEYNESIIVLDCDFILGEFLKSPQTPTPDLIEWINSSLSQTQSLNTIFQLETFGLENLPPCIIPHIHTENQRSPEWLDLLKFYNSTKIPNPIQYINCEKNFNLIKGCLGEILIQKYIQWEKITGFQL